MNMYATEIEIISNKQLACPLCSDGNPGKNFDEQLKHAEWHGYAEINRIVENDPTTGAEIITVRLSRKNLEECHKDAARS